MLCWDGVQQRGTAIRGDGVAVSPDGNYLAVALLDLAEALIVTPVPAPLRITRSDLRIWSARKNRQEESLLGLCIWRKGLNTRR